MRRNLLLKERLRGAKNFGILECATDHCAKVIRKLLGTKQLRRNLVSQNGRDAGLVLREKPLPPCA